VGSERALSPLVGNDSAVETALNPLAGLERYGCLSGEVWLPQSPFRGNVRFANVIKACHACNTVSGTLKLFSCKQQSGKLVSHSRSVMT
jgi:hypothetical protein